VPTRDVRRFCVPDADGQALLRKAVRAGGLSARAFHRVLRVARTIADLAGEPHVTRDHVGEAIQYRTLERVRRPHAAATGGGTAGC
jgi:magnesium chelatase family protein